MRNAKGSGKSKGVEVSLGEAILNHLQTRADM